MDPLTQGLLGASAAMALFHRSLGRGAAAVGAVAGVLADVDVFTGFFLPPVEAMVYHRHATHSLLIVPIGGLLAALPFLFIKAWRYRRKQVIGAALVAYLSHPLLDACTAYGTTLLWPVSNHRFALDAISVIDPIFTLALIVGLAIGVWRERAAVVNAGLIVAGLYLALGLVQHQRGLVAQQALIEVRGHQPVRQRVMPTLGNLVVWRSVYEANNRIFTDGLRLAGEPTFIQGESVPKHSLDKWPTIAADSAVARSYGRFVWFAEGFVGSIDTSEGLIAGDLRYSLTLGEVQPIWAFGVEGQGEDARAVVVEPKGDRKAALRALWVHIWRGDAFEPLPGPVELDAKGIEEGEAMPVELRLR